MNEIDEIIKIEYANQELIKEPYVNISELIENVELPVLNHEITWTQTLLASILSLSEKYCILGPINNIVIPLNNSLGISEIEDFLAYLLKTHFKGACLFKDLEKKLISIGMINKKLSRSFLNRNNKVEIINDIVSLKRV